MHERARQLNSAPVPGVRCASAPLRARNSFFLTLPANGRFHRFILEGVPETARRRPSDPNDVLYRLAARTAVVTGDYPTFIAARHNASVAPKLDAAFYAVDASCIVPMVCFEKREYAAYTIRPKIHKLPPR
jgi:deoxyribodipyrimidine photo-lyase